MALYRPGWSDTLHRVVPGRLAPPLRRNNLLCPRRRDGPSGKHRGMEHVVEGRDRLATGIAPERDAVGPLPPRCALPPPPQLAPPQLSQVGVETQGHGVCNTAAAAAPPPRHSFPHHPTRNQGCVRTPRCFTCLDLQHVQDAAVYPGQPLSRRAAY